MGEMRAPELVEAPARRRWHWLSPASPAWHRLDWAVTRVRWALLAAILLFSLLSPSPGWLGPRWAALALLLAYNALVELLRRRLPRCAASPGCPSLIWPSPR